MFCMQCGQEVHQEARFCHGCGTALKPQALGVECEVATPRACAQYAGFWYRALALLIDWVLANILGMLVVLPLSFVLGMTMVGHEPEVIAGAGALLGIVMGTAVFWLYFTVFESSGWQATPAKRMLGLRVTDADGQRIGFGRANARYWSKILSAMTLYIGFLMVAFTERKQGLHDMVASTLVVRPARQ
ncbi:MULTISPECIES: RDD family protein [unclassified Thioalkalivibrio]|uniref:RDD family protein n=1 Tax=unclassified Thioalkalivibrio TaxID=2621013 RepID=UPI00036B2EC2|nr:MULTISPECIES: RDD family protein [unclassified Thioalkalivibrio]